MAKADLLKQAEKFNLDVSEDNSVKEIQSALDNHYEANPDDKPQELKEEKKAKVAYFKNRHYSALTILIRGGKDALGGEGVVHSARFVPYYDVWKGDVVRVGYLKTDREDVAIRCREDSTCEEIDEKEYNLALEGDDKNKALKQAPIPQV